MAKPKVLVVDDEEMARVSIANVLKDDCAVELAADGPEAISKAKDNNYDVILLDIRMPKMSGIEVLKELQDMSVRSDIIMLTALDEAKLAWQASKSGAFDYIMKPFNNEDLVLRVKMAVKRKETTDLNMKKFMIMSEVAAKSRKLGGIHVKRENLLSTLLTKKGHVLENIGLHEMEAIATGKWDKLEETDIDPEAVFPFKKSKLEEKS